MSPIQGRVLLVEDNPGDAWLVRRMLEGLDRPCHVEHVTHLSAAQDRLRAGDIDAVILDLGLPDSAGIATLSGLDAAANDVPVVVVSGQKDPQLKERVIEHGAREFLEKDGLESAYLTGLLSDLLQTDVPDEGETELESAKAQREGWTEFVAQATTRLNARLYRVAAWLESAQGHLGSVAKAVRAEVPEVLERQESSVGELLQNATIALEASRKDVRRVLALGTRIQHSIQRSRASAPTGTLAAALLDAKETIGSSFGHRFEVRIGHDVMPHLAVDAVAVARLLERIVGAIDHAAFDHDDATGWRLRLATAQEGQQLELRLDAEVPRLDYQSLQAWIEDIDVGSVCAGGIENPAVRLRTMRGTPDGTFVGFGVPILRLRSARQAPVHAEILDRWSSLIEDLEASLRDRNPRTATWMARVNGLVARVLETWPVYIDARSQLSSEIEARAPRLRAELARAERRAVELESRLEDLAASVEHIARTADLAQPSHSAALARLERQLLRWLDDVREDDGAFGSTLVSSMWIDIGSVD